MEKEEILEVLQRWESTGLLTGLPPWEKEELALLYDNVTRVMLSKANQLDNNIYETLGDVTLPTTRRLYRRVGINFEINTMVDELTRRVEENYEAINVPPNKDNVGNLVNPIVEFCVEFADTYEDDDIKKKVFSREQYTERVEKLLETVQTVLLSKEMVSFVDRSESEWKILYSDTKKSPTQVRMWNQKRAIETLHGILNETNQGV
jgi:hypothetical protein